MIFISAHLMWSWLAVIKYWPPLKCPICLLGDRNKFYSWPTAHTRKKLENWLMRYLNFLFVCEHVVSEGQPERLYIYIYK